jgi:hypothetical protein
LGVGISCGKNAAWVLLADCHSQGCRFGVKAVNHIVTRRIGTANNFLSIDVAQRVLKEKCPALLITPANV